VLNWLVRDGACCPVGRLFNSLPPVPS
jgi:hypothetical protein